MTGSEVDWLCAWMLAFIDKWLVHLLVDLFIDYFGLLFWLYDDLKIIVYRTVLTVIWGGDLKRHMGYEGG